MSKSCIIYFSFFYRNSRISSLPFPVACGLTENQLQELLQWVNDEKDARDSLQVIFLVFLSLVHLFILFICCSFFFCFSFFIFVQNLAARLYGDVESLKMLQSSSNGGPVYSNGNDFSSMILLFQRLHSNACIMVYRMSFQ